MHGIDKFSIIVLIKQIASTFFFTRDRITIRGTRIIIFFIIIPQNDAITQLRDFPETIHETFQSQIFRTFTLISSLWQTLKTFRSAMSESPRNGAMKCTQRRDR